MRILLAEDESILNSIITQKLVSDGHSIDSCLDGEEAMELLTCTDYDVIILDIMIPKADGYTVFRSLRDAGKMTPVLFLTTKDAVDDRVKGLDNDANDYLVKPFSFAELSTRLRILTRTSFGLSSNVLKVGDLSLDCSTHLVTRGRKEIILSAKEFALLKYLMNNKGVVLSREEIENHIWNPDYEGSTNVVDVHISYLRRKIDRGRGDKLIHTIRGKGYVMKETDRK